MAAARQGAVTCPWCRRYYPSRPDRGTCDNCEGPLPAPSGAHRGPPPPPAPRTLPGGYRRSVTFTRNVASILGTVFLGVGLLLLLVAAVLLVAGVVFAAKSARDGSGAWGAAGGGVAIAVLVCGLIGVMFAAIAAPLLMVGLRRARRQLAALEHGIPAEGQLVSVQPNLSVRINGQHPWAIAYAFRVGGGEVRGVVHSFTPTDGERSAGDQVWVVYLPTDPTTSTLWPLVR